MSDEGSNFGLTANVSLKHMFTDGNPGVNNPSCSGEIKRQRLTFHTSTVRQDLKENLENSHYTILNKSIPRKTSI